MWNNTIESSILNHNWNINENILLLTLIERICIDNKAN